MTRWSNRGNTHSHVYQLNYAKVTFCRKHVHEWTIIFFQNGRCRRLMKYVSARISVKWINILNDVGYVIPMILYYEMHFLGTLFIFVFYRCYYLNKWSKKKRIHIVFAYEEKLVVHICIKTRCFSGVIHYWSTRTILPFITKDIFFSKVPYTFQLFTTCHE